MKRFSLFAACGGAAMGLMTLSTSWAADQPRADQTQTATTGPTATLSQKVPYGVGDVLKLSRSKVADDVIVTYVQTSGTIYNLKPDDIAYLKNQGVSDKVVNAMLEQRRQPETASTPAKETADSAPEATLPVQSAPEMPPFFAEPSDNIAPAPIEVVQPPVSTLYVIPYGASGYRPYYRTLPGPYWGSTYVIRAPGAACRVTSFGHSFSHSHSGFHSYRHR